MMYDWENERQPTLSHTCHYLTSQWLLTFLERIEYRSIVRTWIASIERVLLVGFNCRLISPNQMNFNFVEIVRQEN